MSKLIDATLALDLHAIRYTVEFQAEEAQELVTRLRPYNNAEPVGMAALVASVNRMIPKMDFGQVNGKPNPNTGHAHHKFRIGREYSRVIYVHIITSYLPENFDFEALLRYLNKVGKNAYADEMTHTYDTHEFTYRWWWD